MATIEICVDSVESAIAAEKGGAQRIELCSGLLEGGLTPSVGLLHAVQAEVSIGVHVLIRPRPGDFVYGRHDLRAMREDIAVARSSGAQGVVLGVLTEDRAVDVARVQELIACARPMQVTFHRALDATLDVRMGFADVLRTGVDRVLTSGGARTAVLGSERLREMVQEAGERLEVMVGGSVRPENVKEIARVTGARAFHAALQDQPVQEPIDRAPGVRLENAGLGVYTRSTVRAERVHSLVLAAAEGGRVRSSEAAVL